MISLVQGIFVEISMIVRKIVQVMDNNSFLHLNVVDYWWGGKIESNSVGLAIMLAKDTKLVVAKS